MKNLFILFLFLLPLAGFSQKNHTVGAKESLFSIGRLYNIHPRELASFNNIPFETGLTIGQVLKIPTKKILSPVGETTANVPQQKPQPAKPVAAAKKLDAGGAAVYHTVAKKEGLYGISKKYNVSIEEIKRWNRLTTDGLTVGSNLIVGYGGSTTAPVVAAVPEKKEATASIQEVVSQPVEPVKPMIKPAKEDVIARTAKDFSGGVFKSFYDEQVANKLVTEDKGMAGIFKSTSGWDDGKYYCLHNAAPAGSYIKITNNVTQKSVYAKVLDLIPDLKQNNGLIIRISNAAAAELGAGAGNFDCTLHF